MNDAFLQEGEDKNAVQTFGIHHFSYLTSQLKNELNLVLPKAEPDNPMYKAFMHILDNLYHNYEESKREVHDLTRQKKIAETDNSRLAKELKEVKNEMDDLNLKFKNKEKMYKNKLKEAEIELKKARGMEKQYMNDIKKKELDVDSIKRTINKESVKSNTFVISSKHDNKKHLEQFNSADNMYQIKLEASNKHIFESFKEINEKLYGTMHQLLNRFRVFCQVRKEYLSNKLNNMQIEDPSSLLKFAEFDKVAEEPADEIDVSVISKVHESVEGCFKFLNAFEIFLNSDFRNFLDNSSEREGSNFKLKDTTSINNYEHIKEVHELQSLLQNFNNIVDNQKNIISLQHKINITDLSLNAKSNIDKKNLIEKSKQNINDIQQFIDKHKKNMEEHDKRNHENIEQLKQAHDKVKEVLELYTTANYINEEE